MKQQLPVIVIITGLKLSFLVVGKHNNFSLQLSSLHTVRSVFLEYYSRGDHKTQIPDTGSPRKKCWHNINK